MKGGGEEMGMVASWHAREKRMVRDQYIIQWLVLLLGGVQTAAARAARLRGKASQN